MESTTRSEIDEECLGLSTDHDIDIKSHDYSSNSCTSSSIPKPVLSVYSLPKIPKLKKNSSSSQTSEKRIQLPIPRSTHFKSLKMKKMDGYMLGYMIPEEIALIEYCADDRSVFSNLEGMIEDSKENEDTYFKLASSMIHLEELSNSMPAENLSAERII